MSESSGVTADERIVDVMIQLALRQFAAHGNPPGPSHSAA